MSIEFGRMATHSLKSCDQILARIDANVVARHAIPAANIQNNPAEFASFPPIFFAL